MRSVGRGEKGTGREGGSGESAYSMRHTRADGVTDNDAVADRATKEDERAGRGPPEGGGLARGGLKLTQSLGLWMSIFLVAGMEVSSGK